ncbi:MAG: A24 family peptidase [Gemmatimonadaceae bacterium]
MALLGGIVFSSLLITAAVGDLRTRRISNRLVVMIALAGLAWSVAWFPMLEGVLRGGAGLLVGLACWLPFYALGWLGAGDVKLFSAAGAWLGPVGVLEASLVGACAGAVLALAWMIRSRGMRETSEVLGMAAGTPSLLSPSDKSSPRSKLPYGIAIAFGAIWAAWLPGLLLA